jgi:hypothetical protein
VTSHERRASPPGGVWLQRFRDLTDKKVLLRRLAFLAESIEWAGPRPRASTWADSSAVSLKDAHVVVTISFWKYPEPRAAWDDDEVLLTCVRRLVAIPTSAMHVVVLTNDRAATEQVLAAAAADPDDPIARAKLHLGAPREVLGRRGCTLSVLQPELRWPRHAGLYLTWAHKRVLRNALRVQDVTHFVYLEDDIGLTADNLRYWIEAREALATSGLVPGFLLYEWTQGQRFLIQQAAPGQYRIVLEEVGIPGFGIAAMATADLPYCASYIMDRALATEHFTRSAFRSPFRSRVAGWGVRERAAAGPIFEPSRTPLRNTLRIGSAPYFPVARSAVPIRPSRSGAPRAEVFSDALLEHLRPTYSTNPASVQGKIRVSEF